MALARPLDEVASPGLETLGALAEAARPLAPAGERLLPVLPALCGLLAGGGLRRGSTVGVAGTGATALALALGAAASAAGSWVGAVGLPGLGFLAAAELGLALDRLLVVAEPPRAARARAVAAMVDAVDVVYLGAPAGSGRDGRRLAARARERGTVLVHLPAARSRGPSPDVALTVAATTWVGLAPGAGGAGRLAARRMEVVATGRGPAARERRAALWLPGPDGAVAPAPSSLEVS